MFKNKQLITKDRFPVQGKVSWESPSNIALIKYWGKFGRQLPANPSLSMTLSEAKTITTVSYKSITDNKNAGVTFRLDGVLNPQFAERLDSFLLSICDCFPFLCQLNLEVDSRNTFPHSSGIASSASGMSAFVLCLCSIESELFGLEVEDELFFRKASYLSRIASGSACRSTYGGFVSWGKVDSIFDSSDEYASPFKEGINPVFTNLQDTILLIDESQKKVASTFGHSLMKNHSFSDARFKDAKLNFAALLEILKSGDFDDFVNLVEYEALSLHAMMMTSKPGYILMKGNTLHAIEKIRGEREQNKLHVCFTLDAGANIHLIYPELEKSRVLSFLENEMKSIGINKWIYDQMGNGPLNLF